MKSGEDLGTEYIIDLLEKYELSNDEHKHIKQYCDTKNISYICTPWDETSVDLLELWGVKAYKVASADLTNHFLIDRLMATGKPLILSTGMSTENEIVETANYLTKNNAEFYLLHCNSTYPAPIQDINLRWLNAIKRIHPFVGYSGHERGINISLGAVALGARVIERHFTLDRNMDGPDHAASLEPEEFKKLVEGIRELEIALGDGGQKCVSQGEMINRENLGKSLVASQKIKAGTILQKDHISVKSPGQGLAPNNYQKLIGIKINRDLDAEDFFFQSDISDDTPNRKCEYEIRLRWGIPVRYHDYQKFNALIKPKIWEFHLSYSDMELEPGNFINKQSDVDFVVHAPELFKDSHLMDLTSPDEDYRQISIMQTQRVIDITRNLNEFFPATKKPLIVANIGGFSMDQPLTEVETHQRYEIFGKSLDQLDLQGVELIPQTMAPFPWHFGGQRYQNLFVNIDEILKWCELLNLNMCFDISHSALNCTHSGTDFNQFCKKILPVTKHIHVGDANGVNGEGLQLGKGSIDLEAVFQIFKHLDSTVSFIPEIWQGHKDNGAGFWYALNYLEGKL